MAGELAKKIRAKYPNAYKSINDDELEAQMVKKYPQYAKLAEPEKGEIVDKHGNIHKPDGTVVHSSFKGKERIDRKFVDTDKIRNNMINMASKTPFPKLLGTLGEIPISAMELFNDPEAVAGGALIKRGMNKINPRVAPSPRPQVEIPNTTAVPITGSREVLPVKSEVSTLPTRAQANETVKQAKANTRVEAPRIRTSDPSVGSSIMAEIESMPKRMPQIDDLKSPTPASNAADAVDEAGSLGPIRKVISEARALQTSLDLSAPLRQGITQIHTKEFWKNLKPMFEAARSEEGFKRLAAEIEARPTFSLMQRAGVEFTDVSKALAKREESMRGTFVEKWIPPVRASNRAYTLFLNKLRADTFDRMSTNADILEDALQDVDEVSKGAKSIAKFVNDATGRGDLGSWEKSAVALNDVFFSPKLIASRVNMLGRAGKATFESISRTGADDAVSKGLRKEALKSMIGYGTLGTISSGISIMGGAKGTEDPKSTDFGKLKIGNTRIDLTGGFQQYFRVATQLSTNLATAISEENDLDIPAFLQNKQSAGGTAGRFLRNKLSPSISAVVDLAWGENVIGEDVERTPLGAGKEMLELITPLIIDDLIELIREDPKMLPAIIPAFFGGGIQSYGAQPNAREGRMPSINMPSMPQMPSISN